MAKACILNSHLSDGDRANIDNLLAPFGFETAFASELAVAELDPIEDVAIVGLPINPTELAEVTALIRECANVGIRVIGVWLREEEAELPDALADFGYSAIGLNPKDLEQAIATAPVWKTPSGVDRPEQARLRNKCR